MQGRATYSPAEQQVLESGLLPSSCTPEDVICEDTECTGLKFIPTPTSVHLTNLVSIPHHHPVPQPSPLDLSFPHTPPLTCPLPQCPWAGRCDLPGLTALSPVEVEARSALGPAWCQLLTTGSHSARALIPRPSTARSSHAYSCWRPAPGVHGDPVPAAAAQAWPPALGPALACWSRQTLDAMTPSHTWTPGSATQGPAWVSVPGK